MAKGDIVKASLQANPSFLNIKKLKKLLLENSDIVKASRAANPTKKFNKGGIVAKTKSKFKGHF
tara:strand:+ start:43 stop:234 length:192 start_codon:yes stop_codon:yes gene_type:complete